MANKHKQMANKHKQIIKKLKHYGCTVTDVTKEGATIKMNPDFHNRIQGVDTDLDLPKMMNFNEKTLYIVGGWEKVTEVLVGFAKAMREDMGFDVVYNGSQNCIAAREVEHG